MSGQSGILHAMMLAGVLAGCGISEPSYEPPTGPGPEVRTDRLSYDWTEANRAEVTAHNPLGSPVYYSIVSYYLILEQYAGGGRWHRRHARTDDINDGTGLRTIPAGGAAHFTVPLTSDYASTSGWYRVRVVLLREPDLLSQWPRAYQVSPPFWLGPARR